MSGNRKRPTTNITSAALGNPSPTGATGGAAPVPVIPAPMPRLSEEQQRFERWSTKGRQTLDTLEASQVQKITSLLRSADLKDAEILQVVGYIITEVERDKTRGDDGLEIGHEEFGMEIHNLPANTTAESLNRIMSKIDPELDSHDLAAHSKLTTPLVLPATGRLATTIKATLECITPTPQLVRWVNGEFSTNVPSIDKLVIRRCFDPMDKSSHGYGSMLGDTRSPHLRILLDLFKELNLSRTQAERLIKSEAIRSLAGTPQAKSIVAVHLDEVTSRNEQGQRRPTHIEYNDRQGKLRVYVQSSRVVDEILMETIWPDLQFGPFAVQLPLSAKRTREGIESMSRERIMQKDARALMEAARFEPARVVRRLEIRMKLTFQPGQERAGRKLSATALEDLLKEHLGKTIFSIVAFDVPRNERNQIDYDGRQLSYIWIEDITEAAGGATSLYATFLQRLKAGGALRRTDWFQALQIKGEPEITLLQPDSTRQSTDAAPSVVSVMRLLENSFCDKGQAAYLHAQTQAGASLVWPGEGVDVSQVTTSAALGAIGKSELLGGTVHIDVRSLVPDAPSHVLLAALLQMAKDKLIIVYDPDPDCKLSDGRTCHTVYATKKDVFLTERLKDMYVRPDADDHDMEDADRPGLAGGGAGGDGSGNVKKSRSGDEAAGSGVSGGKQSAQQPMHGMQSGGLQCAPGAMSALVPLVSDPRIEHLCARPEGRGSGDLGMAAPEGDAAVPPSARHGCKRSMAGLTWRPSDLTMTALLVLGLGVGSCDALGGYTSVPLACKGTTLAPPSTTWYGPVWGSTRTELKRIVEQTEVGMLGARTAAGTEWRGIRAGGKSDASGCGNGGRDVAEILEAVAAVGSGVMAAANSGAVTAVNSDVVSTIDLNAVVTVDSAAMRTAGNLVTGEVGAALGNDARAAGTTEDLARGDAETGGDVHAADMTRGVGDSDVVVVVDLDAVAVVGLDAVVAVDGDAAVAVDLATGTVFGMDAVTMGGSAVAAVSPDVTTPVHSDAMKEVDLDTMAALGLDDEVVVDSDAVMAANSDAGAAVDSNAMEVVDSDAVTVGDSDAVEVSDLNVVDVDSDAVVVVDVDAAGTDVSEVGTTIVFEVVTVGVLEAGVVVDSEARATGHSDVVVIVDSEAGVGVDLDTKMADAANAEVSVGLDTVVAVDSDMGAAVNLIAMAVVDSDAVVAVDSDAVAEAYLDAVVAVDLIVMEAVGSVLTAAVASGTAVVGALDAVGADDSDAVMTVDSNAVSALGSNDGTPVNLDAIAAEWDAAATGGSNAIEAVDSEVAAVDSEAAAADLDAVAAVALGAVAEVTAGLDTVAAIDSEATAAVASDAMAAACMNAKAAVGLEAMAVVDVNVVVDGDSDAVAAVDLNADSDSAVTVGSQAVAAIVLDAADVVDSTAAVVVGSEVVAAVDLDTVLAVDVDAMAAVDSDTMASESAVPGEVAVAGLDTVAAVDLVEVVVDSDTVAAADVNVQVAAVSDAMVAVDSNAMDADAVGTVVSDTGEIGSGTGAAVNSTALIINNSMVAIGSDPEAVMVVELNQKVAADVNAKSAVNSSATASAVLGAAGAAGLDTVATVDSEVEVAVDSSAMAVDDVNARAAVALDAVEAADSGSVAVVDWGAVVVVSDVVGAFDLDAVVATDSNAVATWGLEDKMAVDSETVTAVVSNAVAAVDSDAVVAVDVDAAGTDVSEARAALEVAVAMVGVLEAGAVVDSEAREPGNSDAVVTVDSDAGVSVDLDTKVAVAADAGATVADSDAVVEAYSDAVAAIDLTVMEAVGSDLAAVASGTAVVGSLDAVCADDSDAVTAVDSNVVLLALGSNVGTVVDSDAIAAESDAVVTSGLNALGAVDSEVAAVDSEAEAAVVSDAVAAVASGAVVVAAAGLDIVAAVDLEAMAAAYVNAMAAVDSDAVAAVDVHVMVEVDSDAAAADDLNAMAAADSVSAVTVLDVVGDVDSTAVVAVDLNVVADVDSGAVAAVDSEVVAVVVLDAVEAPDSDVVVAVDSAVVAAVDLDTVLAVDVDVMAAVDLDTMTSAVPGAVVAVGLDTVAAVDSEAVAAVDSDVMTSAVPGAVVAAGLDTVVAVDLEVEAAVDLDTMAAADVHAKAAVDSEVVAAVDSDEMTIDDVNAKAAVDLDAVVTVDLNVVADVDSTAMVAVDSNVVVEVDSGAVAADDSVAVAVVILDAMEAVSLDSVVAVDSDVVAVASNVVVAVDLDTVLAVDVDAMAAVGSDAMTSAVPGAVLAVGLDTVAAVDSDAMVVVDSDPVAAVDSDVVAAELVVMAVSDAVADGDSDRVADSDGELNAVVAVDSEARVAVDLNAVAAVALDVVMVVDSNTGMTIALGAAAVVVGRSGDGSEAGVASNGPIGDADRESTGQSLAGIESVGPVLAGPVAGPALPGPMSAGLLSAGSVSVGPAGPELGKPVSVGSVSIGPVSIGPESFGPVSSGSVSVGPVSTGSESVGPVSAGSVSAGLSVPLAAPMARRNCLTQSQSSPINQASRLFMVAISIDGPGVSPSPVLDGFWNAAAFSILIFLSIYVLFFAVKKPFCCILQTVLDLAVTAFSALPRKQWCQRLPELACCLLVTLFATLYIESSSRELESLAGLFRNPPVYLFVAWFSRMSTGWLGVPVMEHLFTRVEILPWVLLVAVSLLSLSLIAKSHRVGIPYMLFNYVGPNPRPQKYHGLYHTTASLLCYLLVGTTLGSVWLILARLTASGHATTPPTTPVMVARTQRPIRWYVRLIRVSLGVLGLFLFAACIAHSLRYPLPSGIQSWSAFGQPVVDLGNHDARCPQFNDCCTSDPPRISLWVGTRVRRDLPLTSWLHQLPDLRVVPRLCGGVPPSGTEPDLSHRTRAAATEPVARRISTRSTSNTSTLTRGAQALITSPGPAAVFPPGRPHQPQRLIYALGQVPSKHSADLVEIFRDFHNHSAIQKKCADLEIAGHRYLHVEQSDMGRSLTAKIDIPDNTDLSYYIGTANAAGLDPHSNHSMYLGLCGGIPLHVNATRLPGDLPLGACMHLHAHSCNPNGVVYEYIPDGWNNDLALLVFRSIMYIKAGDLVTFAYKGSMWRPYATLPPPPAGFETIRCLCANPCPKDMGRLDWIETVPRLSPQERAKWHRGRVRVPVLLNHPPPECSVVSIAHHPASSQPLAILESLRKEGSHLSVVRPRPPNVDQRHGCAPSPPRHRLQLKKKLMPVWPSMQQTTLDSFTSGPKDNASRRDAVGLSIPVRVDLLVREHGTIEQDGDEQKHGCGFPAGAQRILPDQDGGQTICLEMSDHTDPDVDGYTAKQLGRCGNALGGVDICESARSGTEVTERHGVGLMGAGYCRAGRGDAGEYGGANCTRDPAGPLVLQLSSPSRFCKVMEDVYTLPQLLSHSQRARLARLLTSISKQLRLNPLSGMMRYAVPRGRAHNPQERLEIDLSFLYHLRRTSSRLRVSGQCPLIRHCESEARAALSMLDSLMQQFREGLEASGVQGAENWTYHAYAHENLPSVPAQGKHQDHGQSRSARTYFTLIIPISDGAELTEFGQNPPFATFLGPIMFGGKVWHRGPAVGANTRTILSLVACRNAQDVNHDSALPYPWPKKIVAPGTNGEPLAVVDPAEYLCMEDRLVQPEHLVPGPTLHTHLGVPANVDSVCACEPVQQLMSTAVEETANTTHIVLDEQMDESALLACLDDLQSDDKSCEDALGILRAVLVQLQAPQGSSNLDSGTRTADDAEGGGVALHECLPNEYSRSPVVAEVGPELVGNGVPIAEHSNNQGAHCDLGGLTNKAGEANPTAWGIRQSPGQIPLASAIPDNIWSAQTALQVFDNAVSIWGPKLSVTRNERLARLRKFFPGGMPGWEWVDAILIRFPALGSLKAHEQYVGPVSLDLADPVPLGTSSQVVEFRHTLPNLGNTCFFNSLLQLIASIPSFVDKILEEPLAPDHDNDSYCLMLLKYFIPAIASLSPNPSTVLVIPSIGEEHWRMSEEDLYDFVHRLAVRHDASYSPGAFADPSDLLDYFLSIVPGVARMCAFESKTTTAITCRCLHQGMGESIVCDHGIVTSVDSQHPLSHHIIKLFRPESVCGFRCDQCQTLSTVENPAIRRRSLLFYPRFLRVNVTSPLTSGRQPADFHQHGPLREFEQLDLSQLIPGLQPMLGQYVLRAAIMYSHKHHWTYVHGSPSIYVSDEISRIATSDDLQNVALCARTLIYEQYTDSEQFIIPPVSMNPMAVRQTETDVRKLAFASPAVGSAQPVAVRPVVTKQHQRKYMKEERIKRTGSRSGSDTAAKVPASVKHHRGEMSAIMNVRSPQLRQRTLGDFLQPVVSQPRSHRHGTQAPLGGGPQLSTSSCPTSVSPGPLRWGLPPSLTPSSSVALEIHVHQPGVSVVPMSRRIVLRPAACGATPWIPGTLGLYSRPRGAQPSSEWPTSFPVWNVRVDGLRRQQAMFQTADNLSAQAFYIAADEWTRKDGQDWGTGKLFGAFRSAEDFVSEMLETAATRCFYEIIRRDRPCKAYLDLEADAGAMTEEQGWAMCKAVTHEWGIRVVRRWPRAKEECAQCLAYMVLNGSRMTDKGLKVSYHLVYPWLVFPCNTTTLRDEVTSMSEMEQFQYRTKNGDLKSFIDPAVYTNNRQFRLLLCHKLSDCTRTELCLSNPPTLLMYTRSCITHMEAKAWRVPAAVMPVEITPRPCTQRTRKRAVQHTTFSAQSVPSPVMVFLYGILRDYGQPDGNLTLVHESHLELKFRWEMRPGVIRPCQTSQKWRSSQVGHISNGAWVSIDQYGAIHLLCLHPQCMKYGQANRLLLGQLPWSLAALGRLRIPDHSRLGNPGIDEAACDPSCVNRVVEGSSCQSHDGMGPDGMLGGLPASPESRGESDRVRHAGREFTVGDNGHPVLPPRSPVRNGPMLTREQSFAQVARENQSESALSFQAWHVVPNSWGGRVPLGDISPVAQSVPGASAPSWQEWVGQSEANPFSQHPPPSLVLAVQNILTRDNLSYAKEHALSTDDSAPVLSSVPAAATPAAALVWGIGPSRAWIDAPIVSRPAVGHSLLCQAAVSIHAGSATALNAPYDNNTWSSPFTIGYLNVGRRRLMGSRSEVVDLVLRHRPDILFLGDLVTARHHIGRLKKQLERDLNDEWFVTTNISASSGRPVGMGAIIHCSLAKHMLDCVVDCPKGQCPQAWEAAVGGRILHIKVNRPDLPFTWHIIGVYQHVAKRANRVVRAQLWDALQGVVTTAKQDGHRLLLLGDFNAAPQAGRWGYARGSATADEDCITDIRIQGAGLTEVFQGGKPRSTWRACVGPQSAALDRVFVSHPDLPPLDMTVLWNKPLIVFDHALVLLRLPRETIGVGYAGACRPGESEVSSSRCRVNMTKWRPQVDEWRRLLQLQLQSTESLRDSMDPFEALKHGELCADSIAQTLAPKRLRKSGEVRRAFGFAGNRTLFRELNYLRKARSLVYRVYSGDVELMQWPHRVLCWSLEVTPLDSRIKNSGYIRPTPLVDAPHFYFTSAAHNALVSWLEQAKTAIAVRQAAVRETYEKARYNNLQNLRKKRKDSHGVLDKHTIQEALGKCQPRQRMWGVSGTVVLGVQLDIEAEKHLQILEHLGTMETANDIVHLEGGSTGLTLWFSGPRQAGTFVADCCSGARPLGATPLRMLQPRSQYVALRPDDILAVQEWHMASEGMDTYSVCPACRAKDLQVLSVTSTHQQYGNRARAVKFFCEQCQSLHDEVAVEPMPPCPIPPALLEALRKIPFGTMPLLSRLIDYETLEQCVRKLLNGKATGVDGIPREFYKYGPQGLLELLWAALNAYLRGETPSVCAHEWIGAIAGYIPKKLSALLITEFRPVASISTKFMIFLKIIDIRLDHVTEDYGLIDDAQEGFRQGRSTKRQLAKLHCMLADQRRKKEGISVLLYLDIVNAFNSPTHRAIFSILEAMGFPAEDVTLFRRMYSGSFLVMVNQFGMTAACFLSRGFPQGATPSPRVFNLLFDPVHLIARACGRGWTLQSGLAPSCSSGLADDTALHTAGPDAIPAMAIMVQEVGAYIHWAGMRVHMMKSEIVGVNFKNGERVATDYVTLNGVPFAALAPDEPYKYLGVRATVMGDFSAEKQYVLAEMQQRLTALKDDRALSRREKEQIIVIAVCSVFRYSAGLVDWTKTELDSISKMWARAYKQAWDFSKGMDGSPIILDPSDGGRGCPSATRMWIREAVDTLDQCMSLPGEISRIVGQYLLQQCIAHGCVALNQLQYLLQIGEQTETVLEKLLLRLNEQGLEISSPWVANQEQLVVEALWPRLHQAWKEKERWGGCRELDAEVKENWDNAKLCLQACKKLGSARPPILTVLQFRGAQAQWLQSSELSHRHCFMSAREYTTLISWLSSVQIQQAVLQPAREPLVVSSGPERTSLQLPPCIAGRIKEVIGSTQLALEELPLDDIPDVAISDLSDWQLATYLCQRRAVLSLQCMADSAVSIECLVSLRAVMTPYMMLQEYVIVYTVSDTCSPLAVLQMALIRDCLLDNDRERLRDACSRSPWMVSREDWYAGHLLPNSSMGAPIPRNWRLQEEAGQGQLKLGNIARCISARRVSKPCSLPVPLHPWQQDPPLPSKVVIDISNHTPCALPSPDGWEILRRNGRVWIVERDRRVAQLDAAQYGMLLARYTDTNGRSTPPAEFLSSLGASCRAQRMADLDYYVHWSRHLLASIRQATGAEALIGASAVTYNPHFTSFLSPFECDQSLGALSTWPEVPVLLILDSFHPSRRAHLLQQASLHEPGTWILRRQVGGAGEQDLHELRRMGAHMQAELPKGSRVLHKEGCWEQASWDVFPTRTLTQLWRSGPCAGSGPSRVVGAPPPEAVQSHIEKWDNLRYAFHWGHHQDSPLLLVHRNHQQDAARLSWEGLVAGTDGSVDERTECMGAGYVVGGDVLPLLTLSSRVGGPLASVRAEAASLLQLLRDVSTKYGRSVRLLIFIDCQVLLDILRKWGTHNFHPRPREVVHFDVIYPLLLELRQWLGDLVLMKIKSHTGCLLNERADEYAELGRTAEGPELCPGPQKYGSLWLRVKPIVREYAQQSRKSLPRDSAPNKSLIDKASVVNTYRAVYKRSTIFVKDLLHRSEGTTVSRVIRRCQPAVYRVWLKGMTGTYPTYTYLKRVGLAKSPDCPYCAAGVPETLTHFACVCPQFREARTSAHNQVRQVVSSFFSRCVGPKWTVYEETRMGNMGLNLSKVPAAVVATAGKQVVADSAGECDLQRWQPDWVAISYDHKRIAIIDLCRPSDVHEDQLEAAATLKQEGYTPLIRALDFYTARGWVVHVFPWVVGIRGLLHSSHICALLQFLEVPNKHWLSAVEGTVLASVNAFHFLHRVRFGGLPAGAPLGSGIDQVDLGEDTSDLDASRMIRRCCKRRSPRSQDGGTISQRGSKRRKGHDPLCLPPSGGLCTSQAGPVLGDVTNSTLPCLAGNSMGESREAPQLAASPRASQQSQSQSAAGSIKNVRPPPLVHHPIHGSRATVHQQCHRDRRSRGGGRLRPSRMSANGIYDTNDPRSYISPARRQRTASQVDELWDRWRAVEVKKRRRT